MAVRPRRAPTLSMKAIEILHCQTGAVTSRVDGGVKISFVTPELRPSEAGALLQLHGKNVCVSIVPEDVAPEEKITVSTALETKTPSQRLRNVIYCLYQQQHVTGPFAPFYDEEMEKFINHVKGKLAT